MLFEDCIVIHNNQLVLPLKPFILTEKYQNIASKMAAFAKTKKENFRIAAFLANTS